MSSRGDKPSADDCVSWGGLAGIDGKVWLVMFGYEVPGSLVYA